MQIKESKANNADFAKINLPKKVCNKYATKYLNKKIIINFKTNS